MSIMKQFMEKMVHAGVKVAASGDNWFSSSVGVFTNPEEGRILYAPNSLIESPGLVSWVSLTAVQVARTIDQAIEVHAAHECYPLMATYEEYEMDPSLVTQYTQKFRNAKIVNVAHNLFRANESKASLLMKQIASGDKPSGLIMPEPKKVITDV